MVSEAIKLDLFTSFLSIWWFCLRKLIFPLVVIGIGVGCQKNQSSKTHLVEAEFMVDSSLLEQVPFIDTSSKFQIKTPLLWTQVDSETIQKLGSGMITGDYKNAKLINALINKSDSSMLIILNVTSMDGLVFKVLKSNYEKVLNPNQQWKNVQLGEFKLNCFRIEQYVLQSNEMMHFKLIGYEANDIKNRALFELWYFVNPKNYEKDIKFVESSIGSLNCLTIKK